MGSVRCPDCGSTHVFYAVNKWGRRVLVDSRVDDRYGSFVLEDGRLVHQLDASILTPDRYRLHRDGCPKPRSRA